MYSVSTEIGNNLRKNTGFAFIDVAFTPGYAFDGRFFVGVPLTLSNELFRTDGVQTYESNFRMGISAGYNILSHDNGIVSLSAAFGGSVYTQYHRSLYYDLCAKWGTSAYFKPLVGLGVRYYQSLGNTGRDRLCLICRRVPSRYGTLFAVRVRERPAIPVARKPHKEGRPQR